MLIIGLYDFYRVKRLPICFESDNYTDKYPWYFPHKNIDERGVL